MTATVTVVGNLTRDLELKATSTGKMNVRFSVAMSKRIQKDGAWIDGPTSFFDVVCWGNLAENVAASVGKGSRVIVTGRLEQRSYDTNDGQKRTVVEIVADEVGACMSRATVEVHRVGRDLTAPPVAQVTLDDEEPF